MARYYQSTEAQCPFYNMEDHNKIFCEGIADSMAMIQVYSTEEKAKLYIKRYCHCDWTKCRYARMLWAKYDNPDHIRMMKCGEPLMIP